MRKMRLICNIPYADGSTEHENNLSGEDREAWHLRMVYLQIYISRFFIHRVIHICSCYIGSWAPFFFIQTHATQHLCSFDTNLSLTCYLKHFMLEKKVEDQDICTILSQLFHFHY